MTTVISWRMIEAVTYGMIPSAKTENCESAPPEKRLSRPRIVPPWPVEVVLDRLRVDARRGDPRAEAVDREDHRREEDAAAQLGDAPGVGEPGEHATSSSAAARGGSRLGLSVRSPRRLSRSRLGLGGGSAWRAFGFARFFLRSARLAQRVTVPPAASIFSRAARREAVRGDGELLRQLAVAEDLHVDPRVLDQALLFERLRRDLGAGVEARSRSRTLTGCVYVRNGPIGIASFGRVAAQLAERM